jgi:hypothetical protein
MGRKVLYAYKCDQCQREQVHETPIPEDGAVLPPGWVSRTCNEPLGDGPFTSLSGTLHTQTFCSESCEMAWLQDKVGANDA